MDWLGNDHVGTPTDTHATIIIVLSVWPVPKVYKTHGRSLASVELLRTKRMGVQRSTTEIRELELGVQKMHNKVRE
jgi:hypothetical protein